MGYVQKESVELFVYLTTGIWRGPSTNKQYPTPNKYISERYMPIHGDKCRYCLSLCLSKSPNFVVKDQRNTFSNLICLLSNSYTKLGNVFQYTTLFRGIAAQISPKGSFLPTIIRLEGELCSSEFGRECPILDFASA